MIIWPWFMAAGKCAAVEIIVDDRSAGRVSSKPLGKLLELPHGRIRGGSPGVFETQRRGIGLTVALSQPEN